LGCSKPLVRALLIVVLAAAASRPALADPLADANAAEARGDFAAAVLLYRSLAEKGNVGAQKRLGYLYEIGAGVERDWLKAAEWYSKAADAGDDGAAAAHRRKSTKPRSFRQTGRRVRIASRLYSAALPDDAASAGVSREPIRNKSAVAAKVAGTAKGSAAA
jgi:TPR repeat protein